MRKRVYLSMALFWLLVAFIGAFGVLFSKTPEGLSGSMFISALALICAKDFTDAYERLLYPNS